MTRDTKQLIIRLAVILAVFLTLTALAACRLLDEQPEATYTNYKAAEASGDIERGWIPEYLPKSASNIELKYDIDTY